MSGVDDYIASLVRNHENTRKLDAVQAACAMRKRLDSTTAKRLDSTTAKLTALEAAVRAVRNGDHRGVAMNFHTLDKLYALVPEVGA